MSLSSEILGVVLPKLRANLPPGISGQAYQRWEAMSRSKLLSMVDGLARRLDSIRREQVDRKVRHFIDRLRGAARLYVQEANVTSRRGTAYDQWKKTERQILDEALQADEEFPGTFPTPSAALQTAMDQEVLHDFGGVIVHAREEEKRELARRPAPRPTQEEPQRQSEGLTILVQMPNPPSEPGLWVSPYDYLGDGNFDRYRNGIANLKSEKTWISNPGGGFGSGRFVWYGKGTTEAVAIAVETLQREGFQVRAATEAAAERLREGVENTSRLVGAAEAHLAEMVSRLATRRLVPRPYQMVGIRWLRATKAGALLDVMGLGKTMQCLLAMGDRGIVLCPASVKGVWAKECKRWRPDLRPLQTKGYDSFRWPAKGELLIFNYELIRVDNPLVAPFAGTVSIPSTKPNGQNKLEVRIVGAGRTKSFKVPAPRILVKAGDKIQEGQQLFQAHDDVSPAGPAPAGVCLVIDEAHNLKNPKAMRARAGKAVALAIKIAGGFCWLATATPICNRPRELRALLELIGAFGTAFTSEAEFKRAFGGNVDDVEEAKPTPAAAAALARVSLRRGRSDVFHDTPPMEFEGREVELGGEAKSVAEDLERELRPLVEAAEAEARAKGKSQEELARTIESALNKQATIGAMSRARRIIALAKLPAAIEIIEALEDAGEAILVISAHRETCEALVARDPANWRMIIGDVGDRDQIVEDFQAGKVKNLALTIRSGGVGLTLTRAYYGIAIDLEWNPAVNEQAFARIDPVRGRPDGAEQGPSHWYVLQGDSWIEERIADLLELKAKMIAKTIDPVAKLGGQLPQGPNLGAVEIGLPPAQDGTTREPAKRGLRSHWISDPLTLDRVRQYAAEPKAPSLIKWLKKMVDERGGIPPFVNEQSTSVLKALEDFEVELEQRRRKQKEYQEDARQAKTRLESFAQDALLQLADLDPDKARKINDLGFGGSTQDGHRLAALIRAGIGLTDKDWQRAITIARIHHRQVGKAPDVAEKSETLAACGRQEVRACEDDVSEIDDGRGPVIVRTRCGYDPQRADQFKRDISMWRPFYEAWRTALDLVARKGGVDRRYRAGLLLCTDNKAFTTSGIGESVVYLQPELLEEIIQEERSPHAVAVYLHHAAAHELAHLDGRMGHGHDADFIAAREDLGQRTGAIMPQLVELAETLMRAPRQAGEGMPLKRWPKRGYIVVRVVRGRDVFWARDRWSLRELDAEIFDEEDTAQRAAAQRQASVREVGSATEQLPRKLADVLPFERALLETAAVMAEAMPRKPGCGCKR